MPEVYASLRGKNYWCENSSNNLYVKHSFYLFSILHLTLDKTLPSPSLSTVKFFLPLLALSLDLEVLSRGIKFCSWSCTQLWALNWWHWTKPNCFNAQWLVWLIRITGRFQFLKLQNQYNWFMQIVLKTDQTETLTSLLFCNTFLSKLHLPSHWFKTSYVSSPAHSRFGFITLQPSSIVTEQKYRQKFPCPQTVKIQKDQQ